MSAAEIAQAQTARAERRRAPRPTAMLWWSLGLLAGFALMGLLVGRDPASPFTQPLDDWWRGLAGVSMESVLHTSVVPMFFQHLGEGPGALVGMVLIPLGLVIVGRWRSALFFLTVTLVGPGLFSQGMKNLVDRPRPAADEALGLFGPLFRVDHGSFPSGHAVMTAALVFGVAALIPTSRRSLRRVWWIVAGLLMLGMMWQRTLINAHWLSDTFFGLVAGAAGALLMWWVFWPLLQLDHGRPVWFRHLAGRNRSTPA